MGLLDFLGISPPSLSPIPPARHGQQAAANGAARNYGLAAAVDLRVLNMRDGDVLFPARAFLSQGQQAVLKLS